MEDSVRFGVQAGMLRTKVTNGGLEQEGAILLPLHRIQ